MRQRTDEACQKTTQGCKDIVTACEMLANAAKNPYQKKILLDGRHEPVLLYRKLTLDCFM